MTMITLRESPLSPITTSQVPVPTSKQYIFCYLWNCRATMDSKNKQYATLESVILIFDATRAGLCSGDNDTNTTPTQSILMVNENQDHPEIKINPRGLNKNQDPLFPPFSQSDIRAIISAPYLFGVVTFVLFAVATPNKYGDLLFESRMTSPRLREYMNLI